MMAFRCCHTWILSHSPCFDCELRLDSNLWEKKWFQIKISRFAKKNLYALLSEALIIFFGKCSSKYLSRDTRTKINLNMRAWKCQSEGNVKKFYGIKNVSHKNLHKLLFLCFKMQNFVLSWVELKFLLELFSSKNLSSFESIKCWKFMTRAIKFIFA